jgi:hypothetical protein
MRNRDQHLSERELLLSADGELPARHASEVRAHLDACWSCRTRLRDLESTIADFVRTRDAALNHAIPPAAGPGAMLRARLEQAAFVAAPRRWNFLPAAAALALVGIAMIAVFGGNVNAEGPRPKNNLTPGETRSVTLSEVCGTAEIHPAEIPFETQRIVFAEYGMSAAQAAAYEVDYLITPELGGADSIRNLWPQPYSARWNARVKDRLEQRLHQLVCDGKLDLATAQYDISTDWIGAYKKYVGLPSPR